MLICFQDFLLIIGGSDGRRISNKVLKFDLKEKRLLFKDNLKMEFAGAKIIKSEKKDEFLIFGGT